MFDSELPSCSLLYYTIVKRLVIQFITKLTATSRCQKYTTVLLSVDQYNGRYGLWQVGWIMVGLSVCLSVDCSVFVHIGESLYVEKKISIGTLSPCKYKTDSFGTLETIVLCLKGDTMNIPCSAGKHLTHLIIVYGNGQ